MNRFEKNIDLIIKRIKETKDIKSKLTIVTLWKVLVLLVLPLFYSYVTTIDSRFNRHRQPPPPASLSEEATTSAPPVFVATFDNLSELTTFEQVVSHVFYVDAGAYVYPHELDLQHLASLDLRTPLRGSTPRVLITHTHSQEFFIDSDLTDANQSIQGVGQYLATLLSTEYNIGVIHDVGTYDLVAGERVLAGAYERWEQGVLAILALHPTIEVIIDLHRDAAPEGVRLVTQLGDQDTAQLMFFNGITRRRVEGEPKDLNHLFNPYLQENLALSLQLFLHANETFPGLARRNYIKAYRYSLHLRPRSLLVEVGGHTNTLQEAKNAMAPLATLLVEVLGY